MTSYGEKYLNKDATDYIDWNRLGRKYNSIAVSDTTYPEPFIISNDDSKKFELAKQSQLTTREIGRRKERFPINSKGHLRIQYFNKACFA